MNILVLGGGTKGKFGNDFVSKAKEEGHAVKVLSHIDHQYNDPNYSWANYDDLDDVRIKIKDLVKDLPCIDLVLFNQNHAGHPNGKVFVNNPSEYEYYKTLRIQVVIPHVTVENVYDKLHASSKIVFMTTNCALTFENDKWTDLAGYSGGKAYALHLMRLIAMHNDIGFTCHAVSPSFRYDDLDHYNNVFSHTYKHIMNHGRDFNGKIVGSWDPNGHMPIVGQIQWK
jgi:hypothetical protein